MLVFYRLLGLVVIVGIMLSGMALYSLITWVLPELFGIADRADPGRGHRHHRLGRYHRRLVHRVLRAHEGRAARRRDGALVRRPLVHPFLPHHRRRRPRVADRRGRALRARHRVGARASRSSSGISTILDLFVAYFFMHPLVSLMARRPSLVRMPGVGIAAGLDAPAAGGDMTATTDRHPRRRSGSGTRSATSTTSARTSSSSSGRGAGRSSRVR